MKRKFYSFLFAAALFTVTAVGCAKGEEIENTAGNTAGSTEEDTEEPVEETLSQEELYSRARSIITTFPDSPKSKVYNYKYTLRSDETMTANAVRTIAENGNIGDFSYIGPKEIGTAVCEDPFHIQFSFVDKMEKPTMELWTCCAPSTQEEIDEMLDMDKETMVGFANASCPYPEDGYYNCETVDDTVIWKFTVENDRSKGYAYYMLRLSDGACYQFQYTEKRDIYDEKRVNDLLESIRFEDYSGTDWENG